MQKTGVGKFKAIGAGAVLSVILIFMSHYSQDVTLGSHLTIDHVPAGGIFILFIFILLNSSARAIRRSWCFGMEELIIIYVMLLVTSTITTRGLVNQLVPLISAPFYYATPENRWAELIHPHLRSWLHPSGESTVRHFYEGLPPGAGIPWGDWAVPVLSWFVMILALYMVMIFLMVILRKQWVEREKLTYPLVVLPLEMVRSEEKGHFFPGLFRNRLFWVAFMVPVVIGSINSLHNNYFPFIPYLRTWQDVEIFQRTTFLRFRLSFPIMGFTYLMNQEVAFGVWFFNLMFLCARGFMNISGLDSPENLGVYGAAEPLFHNVGTGAFFSLVIMAFWMARSHLKDVFGKAFGKGTPDDSDEIVSYKAAVFGLIAGLVIMLIWLALTGLSIFSSFLFILFMLIFFVGLTRVIAETGLATIIAPSTASAQVVSSLGSSSIGNEGMASLGMTYAYAADTRTFPMSAAAQGLKIGEWVKERRKGGMFPAMLAAIFISYFLSVIVVLHLAYTYGGINLRVAPYVNNPQHPLRWASSHMLNPMGASIPGWFARGGGAILMAFLMFIRYRFLWWPFHPLGFALGSVSMIDHLWFSIFLVWFVKALILNYGGVKMFRKARPFFLGLILGQYSAASIWFLIDLVAGNTGNQVFWI